MARMPTFDEIRGDFERGIRTAEQRIEHPFRHNDEPRTAPHVEAALAARQAPAQQPVNLAAATARPKENPVSLATLEDDFLGGVTGVENEIAKLKARVPAIVAEAKAFASTPLGQLAVTAAGHLAAGVLPPEALAIVESGAADLYNRIFGLYNPQGAQQAPAAPVAALAQ